MTLAHVDEALERGVRLEAICERLGVAPRTIQRWRMRVPEHGEHRFRSMLSTDSGPR
ncbi:helix-turn-helix domain-containing protein [Myxococcus sp. CA033]|uniref:helix-turn-helix domain-containing protein n=1 Tax=Myxococcus sp. CA033 TaxID=2741516 RepID=UPI00157AC5F7|nr:helix-turn-helix domain-containing protein [Myxococcus sp. CA033]